MSSQGGAGRRHGLTGQAAPRVAAPSEAAPGEAAPGEAAPGEAAR